MQERINEIIEFLIKEISQLAEPATLGLNLEELSERLLEEGYTEREIHKAVEWVVSDLSKKHLSLPSNKEKKTLPSLRILVAEELSFFTPEAYGYLIQLQTLGIIVPMQVEQVIERCFFMGLTRIDVDELKSIVFQILLGKETGTIKTKTVYHPGNDKLN